ncbi:hypothetical protein KDX31_01470 [Amphritea atlantica]|uniref:Uncharacterized protein n=1 Tax=Amphritea atlantica TaxID=355243 RepID=A0ABY5GWW8_9GAMM|nr:hypothetical protein KDX31_01470 [Amphritea atlantica]
MMDMIGDFVCHPAEINVQDPQLSRSQWQKALNAVSEKPLDTSGTRSVGL